MLCLRVGLRSTNVQKLVDHFSICFCLAIIDTLYKLMTAALVLAAFWIATSINDSCLVFIRCFRYYLLNKHMSVLWFYLKGQLNLKPSVEVSFVLIWTYLFVWRRNHILFVSIFRIRLKFGINNRIAIRSGLLVYFNPITGSTVS